MSEPLPVSRVELYKAQDENKFDLILYPPPPRTDAVRIELSGIIGLELAYWGKRKP